MAILGIIILLGVGVVTATIVASGSNDANFTMVGLEVQTSVAGVFGFGALCLLLTVLGLFLLFGGAKRSRRRHKEVKDLRRRADPPTGAAAGTATDEADRRGTAGGGSAGPPGRRRTGDEGGVGDHYRGIPRD